MTVLDLAENSQDSESSSMSSDLFKLDHKQTYLLLNAPVDDVIEQTLRRGVLDKNLGDHKTNSNILSKGNN